MEHSLIYGMYLMYLFLIKAIDTLRKTWRLGTQLCRLYEAHCSVHSFDVTLAV
jgi:hypothetical protein